uniref:G-protein coupled receptors family 1 profile domain-containing protein n=1 Tax=Panagrolaimus sp. PS1159 TaxID=55785 RepID=A0AC35F1C8_9BILA
MSSTVADFDTLPIVNASRLLLGILSTIGNLFILSLFFYSPKLRQFACTVLIALLCFSDLLVGIGLLIRATYSITAAQYYKKSTCYAVNSLIGIGKTASEIVIFGISIDRYNAVYKPVIYSRNEKNNWFILRTIVLAIILSFALTWAKQIEVDYSIPITVCTAAAATGPYSFLVTTVYTGIFLIILYCKF